MCLRAVSWYRSTNVVGRVWDCWAYQRAFLECLMAPNVYAFLCLPTSNLHACKLLVALLSPKSLPRVLMDCEANHLHQYFSITTASFT